jgi:hypothetical protein
MTMNKNSKSNRPATPGEVSHEIDRAIARHTGKPVPSASLAAPDAGIERHGAELAKLARDIAKAEGLPYPKALAKAGKLRPDLLAQYQER